MQRGELIIPLGANKPIRGIHSPETQQMAEALGSVSINRASHVEPGSNLSQAALEWIYTQQCQDNGPCYVRWTKVAATGQPPVAIHSDYANKWFADCLPVGGPVLGPFNTPEEARTTEVKWLKDNNVPTCHDCADKDINRFRTQIEPITEPVLTEEDLQRLP